MNCSVVQPRDPDRRWRRVSHPKKTRNDLRERTNEAHEQVEVGDTNRDAYCAEHQQRAKGKDFEEPETGGQPPWFEHGLLNDVRNNKQLNRVGGGNGDDEPDEQKSKRECEK